MASNNSYRFIIFYYMSVDCRPVHHKFKVHKNETPKECFFRGKRTLAADHRVPLCFDFYDVTDGKYTLICTGKDPDDLPENVTKS